MNAMAPNSKLGLTDIKLALALPTMFLAGNSWGLAPLAAPLDPLPESEYESIFAHREGTVMPAKVLHQGLFAAQTTIRAFSAKLLADNGDAESIPYLIDALSDQSAHVGAEYPKPGMHTTRYWAGHALMKLTKKDFGFIWNDSEKRREKAIARWRSWYLNGQKKRKP